MNRLILNKITQYDPTRTSSTRRRFIEEVNRRFKRLKKIVYEHIIEGALLKDNFLLFNQQMIVNVDWVSKYDPKKIPVFMDWLEKQNERFILSGEGSGLEFVSRPDTQWTDKYIRSAYQKGISRARQELKKAGADIPVSKRELGSGLGAAFNQPIHIDRIQMAFTQTYTGMKGITKAMDSPISRILAMGMAEGRSPKDISILITGEIGKVGLTRARAIARTEVIRAHHNANINEYEAAGIEGVTVKAEWSTAGFNVCPICEDREGKTYTLEGIRGMIPAHPNCLLDGQVKIYTSKGWKKIKDIQIGNLVLTHKGRFRKVIDTILTYKQTPNAIRFGFGGTQQMRLSVTDNHPVLINGEWVEAKDIKKGSEISYLADECKRKSCKELTPYFKNYCSRTCLSKDITDRQWSNSEHRRNIPEKVSKQMLREYKLGIRDKDKITKKANERMRELVKQGKWILQQEEVRESGRHLTNTLEMRKKSSERMKKNNPMSNLKIRKKATLSFKKYLMEHPERRLNVRLGKYRKSGNMTWIEKRMAVLLDKLGIDYIFQYPILNYDVDFAIPALKIAIECDGEYWHKNKNSDKKRQRKIEKEGWFVLRYTGKKINQCFNEIEDELLRVFGNHKKEFKFISRKIIDVKKWKVKSPRILYNLSVEEDESYIANGFVVHNCRCVAIPADVGRGRIRRNRGEEGIEERKEEGLSKSINIEKLFESGKALDFKSLPLEAQKRISRAEFDATNGALRFGAKTIDDSIAIDNLFKDYGIKLSDDTMGFRGVKGVPYSIVEGESFKDAGYFRFSGDKARAEIFIDKNIDVQLIKVKLPKNSLILPGDHAFEKEAFLPRNSKFKVEKVVKKLNGGRYVDGEAVNTHLYEITVRLEGIEKKKISLPAKVIKEISSFKGKAGVEKR